MSEPPLNEGVQTDSTKDQDTERRQDRDHAHEPYHQRRMKPRGLASMIMPISVMTTPSTDTMMAMHLYSLRRLALEPLFQIGISRDILRQHLDGDRAVEAGVRGFVDLAHTPGRGGVVW